MKSSETEEFETLVPPGFPLPRYQPSGNTHGLDRLPSFWVLLVSDGKEPPCPVPGWGEGNPAEALNPQCPAVKYLGSVRLWAGLETLSSTEMMLYQREFGRREKYLYFTTFHRFFPCIFSKRCYKLCSRPC